MHAAAATMESKPDTGEYVSGVFFNDQFVQPEEKLTFDCGRFQAKNVFICEFCLKYSNCCVSSTRHQISCDFEISGDEVCSGFDFKAIVVTDTTILSRIYQISKLFSNNRNKHLEGSHIFLMKKRSVAGYACIMDKIVFCNVVFPHHRNKLTSSILNRAERILRNKALKKEIFE